MTRSDAERIAKEIIDRCTYPVSTMYGLHKGIDDPRMMEAIANALMEAPTLSAATKEYVDYVTKVENIVDKQLVESVYPSDEEIEKEAKYQCPTNDKYKEAFKWGARWCRQKMGDK